VASVNKNGSVVLDREGMNKALDRLAHEIIENYKDKMANLAMIGIKRRGAYIAKRLVGKIEAFSGSRLLLGALDITLYRDDMAQLAEQPVMHATEIDFGIDGKSVILVDDVLYTGRTIRCALDALIDFGRPSKIELAVLIDRGHRELPIRADYVGKNIPTARDEAVNVKMAESEGTDEVRLEPKHG
jgi:pyrimidine operon attenuation protein/uracil phosphoribosyltransferase